MRKFFRHIWFRQLFCVALALTLACSFSGCKPTDFFVEKIITPAAETVDENNANQIMINSPDADRSTDALAALDWTDQSTQSLDVQNLVVWSETPNTTLTTHRSVFDVAARFPGIAASDKVKLVYNSKVNLQGDVQANSDTDLDVNTSSSGGLGHDSTDPNASSSNDSTLVVSGEQTSQSEDIEDGSNQGSSQGSSGSGSEAGSADNGQTNQGSTDGSDSGSGAGDNPSPEPGRQPNYEGYGGEVKTFKTNSALVDPPQVESVGVIGKQAAVLVQAIGGQGAISAMSGYDYDNVGVNSTKSFSQVYSDEFDVSKAYIWAASNESDFSQMSAEQIVAACGWDGLIIFDSNVFADEEALNAALPEDVKQQTYGYNIQFMIADMSSVTSMSQSATMVGKALSGSTALSPGWSSVDMANQYRDTLGSFASGLSGVYSSTKSEYVSLATDAVEGASINFDSTGGTLTNQLLLFSDYSQDSYKPLVQWLQLAGITPTGNDPASVGRGALALMLPTLESASLPGSSSAISKWRAAGGGYDKMLVAGHTEYGNNNGLGSEYVPYLVVSGSSDGSLSASQVASSAESSLESYEFNKRISLYAAFQRTTGSIPENAPFTHSYIGEESRDSGGDPSANPLLGSSTADTQQRVASTVRANPEGALGSWTEASFESPLEGVWMAALYSNAPFSASKYTPTNNWGSVSVTVGNATIKGDSNKSAMENARAIIEQFYETFYRDADCCPDASRLEG